MTSWGAEEAQVTEGLRSPHLLVVLTKELPVNVLPAAVPQNSLLWAAWRRGWSWWCMAEDLCCPSQIGRLEKWELSQMSGADSS